MLPSKTLMKNIQLILRWEAVGTYGHNHRKEKMSDRGILKLHGRELRTAVLLC